MDDEKRSNAFFSLKRDFDNFLFALVGEDQNGMDLSVNSALARSNVDPWEEAAALTQLPHDLAMQRLTTLIAALPEGSSRHADPAKIAERLIALLPRHSARLFPPNTAVASARSLVGSLSGSQIFIFAILLGSMAGGQWLASNLKPAPLPNQAVTPACNAPAPQPPSPSAD